LGLFRDQALLKDMPGETNVVAAMPLVVTLRFALPTITLFAFFIMEVALFLQHPTTDA
jgi:hypothetical protein